MDRNVYCDTDSVKYLGSLSARRAWIEMNMNYIMGLKTPVALRKESVDRNMGERSQLYQTVSRSPQGERG